MHNGLEHIYIFVGTMVRYKGFTTKGINMKHLGMERSVCAVAVLLGVAGAALAGGPPKVTDGDITFWVQDAIRSDARISGSQVSAGTSEGIVTLTGSVSNLAAKNYAVREAKKIRGVKAVIDSITVAPAYRTDSEITADVRRRILNSTTIESKSLTVKVNDGSVTLGGTVGSWAEVDQGNLLATQVRGVKEVQNNLVSDYAAKRSDQEVKDDAIAALNRDVYTSGMPITVSVSNGIVALKGSVGNAYEKSRAEEKARWIDGVKKVDNGLVVDWSEENGARKAASWSSDDALQREVLAALTRDKRLDAKGVVPNVGYGTVTLTGAAHNGYQRRIAEQDARDVVGVGWVTNRLSIDAAPRDDSAIRADILANLALDYALTPSLDVAVSKGVVTLTGREPTWFDKDYAGDLAYDVRGVKQVVNKIRVPQVSVPSDSSLTAQIDKSLEWNWTTFWVHNDINVHVKDGVAKLNGNVNNWSERNEAERVALRTPGIWLVDDELTVKGFGYPWETMSVTQPVIYDPAVRVDSYYLPWWAY